MTVAPNDMVLRGRTIKGSLVSNICEIDEVLQFAKRGTFGSSKTMR